MDILSSLQRLTVSPVATMVSHCSQSKPQYPNNSFIVKNWFSLSGNTSNWNGWYEDGEYTAGTEIGTFTSSSLTTTVGQSNGPGGGGHGGGSGNGGSNNGGWGPGWWN